MNCYIIIINYKGVNKFVEHVDRYFTFVVSNKAKIYFTKEDAAKDVRKILNHDKKNKTSKTIKTINVHEIIINL
jgi:hypothetical protein